MKKAISLGLKGEFMKSLILALTFIASASFAQVGQPVTPVGPQAPAVEQTLKSVMKEMSTKLKAIAAQAGDVTLNASSEALARELVTLVENGKALFPKTAQDQASQNEYVKMMDDTSLQAQALAEAFHANNNVLANEILAQLSQAKKDGHAKFKK